MRSFVLIIWCFLFCGSSFLFAQNTGELSPPQTIEHQQLHSPKKATIFSACLPGLGQIYNKKYWKVPLIYGGFGAVTYFAVTNKQQANQFKQEFRLRSNNIAEGRNLSFAKFSDNAILSIYRNYQRNFELSIMIGGLFYLLNVLDAFVDAHLFDFNISDNLSMQLSPATPSREYPYGLSVSLKF